jgi:hypothetical protein
MRLEEYISPTLPHVSSLTKNKLKGKIPLQVDYSLIAPEASMAMKKTPGGDSPLRQGAEKSFWTIPISGRRWRRIVMCFWKIDWVFRFFPSEIFIGEGAASEVD